MGESPTKDYYIHRCHKLLDTVEFSVKFAVHVCHLFIPFRNTEKLARKLYYARVF